MTTHSPSTVALAPEDSVFELRRNPRSIEKCSISSATKILSSGFISVTKTDIVVITESAADPEYYQPVYNALISKNLIQPHPTLTFIPSSSKESDGTGGGCSQVQNWAPKLHELGLDRFRGLIDFDGKNTANAVIQVLNRYSIENYLFDPLTLSAYLLHRGIYSPFDFQREKQLTIRDLITSTADIASQYVLQFCNWLSKETSLSEISQSELISHNYLGMKDIKIPSWWISTKGHNIEKLVLAPLNKLGSSLGRGVIIKPGNRGELINFQCISYPELISFDFIQIFNSFLSPAE